MIEIRGKDIYRSGKKIGFIVGNYICDETGKRLGYFTSDSVRDLNGRKLAYVSGNKVYSGSRSMDLDEVLSGITAPGLSDAACVAITSLL